VLDDLITAKRALDGPDFRRCVHDRQACSTQFGNFFDWRCFQFGNRVVERTKMRTSIAALAALLIVLAPWWASPARAQQASRAAIVPTGPAVPAPTSAARAVDAADLGAYVDGVVEGYMRRLGIAGATVAVVDAQGALLLRGYGIAGLNPERRVDPARTLFRIGSTSKTFTYLQALMLIDAGKLDLDAPVNRYLPNEVRLPDDDYAPVLVRHLLTHTAGFEDSALGHLFAKTPQDVVSLADYVRRHRPMRVREPGTHAVYSNYSVALLGVLVQAVSGTPFETLAERDLFAPMGMHHTTFREPLGDGNPRNVDARFKGLWSDGFERTGGGFATQDFEYISSIAPAGAVSSNAADMARYMTMLVNRGQLDGRQIVPASAFARLEGAPLFSTAPEATGFAYGFFRKRYGQVQSLEHGGATLMFHTNMVAVPELGLGIFVSTNTGTGVDLVKELPALVLERYFPRARAAALPAPPKDFALRGKQYVGAYLNERRAYHGFEKLLLSSAAQIGLTDDGYLTLTAGNDTSRWVEDKPNVFRAVNGSGRLVFLTDQDGEVTGFVTPYGHDVFNRAGAFDSANLLYMLLGLALLTALGVLTGAWLRRKRPRAGEALSAMRSARWLYATAAAWLLFAVVFGIAFAQLAAAGNAAIFSYPGPLLRIALWLSLPALLLTLACAPLLWSAWRARGWGFWRKSRHTLAVLTFISAGYAMWVWNVVGWKA